jgi:hypothetical protein
MLYTLLRRVYATLLCLNFEREISGAAYMRIKLHEKHLYGNLFIIFLFLIL